MMRATVLILSAILLGGAFGSQAAPSVSATAEEALKRSRAVEGNVVGSHQLLDQDGQPVDITRYRGKPVVISMIYTACDHTCPVTTQNVARAVAGARKALGKDSFQVLSIGFDTVRDTPEALKVYAKQQGIDTGGWSFLAGNPATMEALAGDLGFSWYVTSRGFDHIAQTTVLDGQGRIYRQVYGENFELPLLVEPLKDLVLGRAAALTSIQSISDRVRFFCTVYDPHSDAYRFDYGIFFSIGSGFLAVLTIIWMTIRMWRDSKRTPRQPTA
ncbi:Cytochrome oxidase biogenesis protein Sco1/SenC/PrrC putative copper metallochaperone [Paramagnetospirillum magnetotacticum MS-1]|uniref:Cytochrome oxidase biogenesis protein Sco1/SenC/PrrC putative copper metallochaperone n=1 Tax=Paramagnetospirillum magnetotacticum MS-1 TaxID=272627 RepID=A0A0C2V0U8_PARME|nr:SCO family protein [Paramagnetospirillum magnetotacticum]KIL98691.1 Cytochrome oxidase biogenesis protein Sco1/SenC/PrrC putative copper metallochaperone [Paramagnetospirillum magnetotacticum MS-1]